MSPPQRSWWTFCAVSFAGSLVSPPGAADGHFVQSLLKGVGGGGLRHGAADGRSVLRNWVLDGWVTIGRSW